VSSSVWRMSPSGRLGPVFQAPLFRLEGILGRASRSKQLAGSRSCSGFSEDR
jgi:hypothetical protein